MKVLWFRLFEQTLWPSEKAEEMAEDAAETLAEEEFFADVTVTDPIEESLAENPVPVQNEMIFGPFEIKTLILHY